MNYDPIHDTYPVLHGDPPSEPVVSEPLNFADFTTTIPASSMENQPLSTPTVPVPAPVFVAAPQKGTPYNSGPIGTSLVIPPGNLAVHPHLSNHLNIQLLVHQGPPSHVDNPQPLYNGIIKDESAASQPPSVRLSGLHLPLRDMDLEAETQPGALPADFRQTSTGFKHLKKADGEPFWRKDIQYDFLHELFTDEHRVFTNNFAHCEVANAANGPKLTFSELYVRTLAELLKSSKVLRERLIRDSDMGLAVSKVCLLVNAGRMNTTVNFVPDMRLALRTYHLIPSLQETPDGPRPLQDTPRLKTILKAVCDGEDHFQTLLDLLKTPPAARPNTNVIKLVFLMSTFFQNIPFHYDDLYEHDLFSEKLRFIKALPGPQNKFMEFFLNDDITPKNRSRRFLWLIYTYLETGFTAEELANNPFNPHVIPPIEYLPPNSTCDVDTESEIAYAVRMYHTRMMHLGGEVVTTPKRAQKAREKKARKLAALESRPLPGAGDDDANDLGMVDDEDGTDDEEPVAARVVLERIAKRKKPALPLAILEEHNPELGLPLGPLHPLGVDSLQRRWSVFSPIYTQPLNRENPTSVVRRRAIAAKSRTLVALVARSAEHYDQRRQELLGWMYQYFQHRKNEDGLLAIEYEDIRSDIMHSVETYLYQQTGKLLIIQHHADQMLDERNEQGEPELLRRESFVTAVGPLAGDLAPVDVGSIEKLGSGYVPVHDLNHANERTAFEYQMMSLVEMAVAQNASLRSVKDSEPKFDLYGKTIRWS